ncbi:hypothetical protein H6G81_34400 [Scytonema hofmannii FACHB-248]|uniref:Uncharacterized protein n=1 Tax=Scytonema hofmannii FACHB-248 TaxID=1842502 RepID=A0ABR8H275_9CYAN|nr:MULTISPECIES: hypothetical protein [Nostocales]MBD2609447.1 hypothetical protein [Scytonema hofmannii FACHB-248]
MAEPTLVQVFGAGATQTATTITIAKADLPGLTASATNRAEALIAGILLKAKAALLKTTFDAELDQSVYIESGYPTFTFRGDNNDSYRVDQLTVNFAKIDTSAVIDPDDY